MDNSIKIDNRHYNYKEAKKIWIYISLIALATSLLFVYIFKPTLDMNGDTSQYYIYATSLAQGEGYTELSSLGHPPANGFPPGYPLIMAPIRAITDSIIAQKVLNGFMLFGAAVLLFLFLRKVVPQPLAFTIVLVSLLNYRVLQFATIMMSETAYLFFSTLAIYLLWYFNHSDQNRTWWKNPYFYLLILVSGYSYMIRTQGITLIVGITIWMLCVCKWRQAIGFVVGFVITTLPWAIRNRIVGLGGSRYLDQVLAVNIWQPDKGYVSFGELVGRGCETLQMLITKALPDTVTPYFTVDYNAEASIGEWVIGLLLIVIILIGFWRMKHYFWFFTTYSVAVFGIICLWSAPSGNRYITTLVPLLEIGIALGAYTLIEHILYKIMNLKKAISPIWLLIPALLFATPKLYALSEESKQPLPPQLAGYIDAAKAVREYLPSETVVCCRKPSVFFVYAQCPVCNFIYTENDEKLIRGLISSQVDYVVLDQMGYAATAKYLYPAIVKNQELFELVAEFRNPQTYLIKFDRIAAVQKFGTE